MRSLPFRSVLVKVPTSVRAAALPAPFGAGARRAATRLFVLVKAFTSRVLPRAATPCGACRLAPPSPCGARGRAPPSAAHTRRRRAPSAFPRLGVGLRGVAARGRSSGGAGARPCGARFSRVPAPRFGCRLKVPRLFVGFPVAKVSPLSPSRPPFPSGEKGEAPSLRLPPRAGTGVGRGKNVPPNLGYRHGGSGGCSTEAMQKKNA